MSLLEMLQSLADENRVAIIYRVFILKENWTNPNII